MTSQDYSTMLHLPTSGAGLVKLSPFDKFLMGQGVAMMMYYRESLDTERLKESLVKTLEHFPLLCGRFTEDGSCVTLNNAGVPFEVSYTSDVIDDVVSSKFKTAVEDGEQPGYSIYDQDDELRFIHSVKKDRNLTSQNLVAPLAVKITVMSPGTVISIFFEHTVVDAQGAS